MEPPTPAGLAAEASADGASVAAPVPTLTATARPAAKVRMRCIDISPYVVWL